MAELGNVRLSSLASEGPIVRIDKNVTFHKSAGTLTSYGTVPNPAYNGEEQSKTSDYMYGKAAIKEEQLKTSIFYHISNPIARWRADHHRFPVKMTVQLLKMLCVVTQAALLMNNPVSKYPKFQAEIQDVFSNILCQPSPNILPANTRGNPYNIYTYNLYTMDELMNVLDNVGDLFNNLSTLLGAYDYFYDENGTIHPVEITFTQYSHVVLNTTHATVMPGGNNSFSEQFLHLCGRKDCFQSLLKTDISFLLTNVRMIQPEWVQCFGVTIKLSMESEGGGRMQLSLTAKLQCINCDNESEIPIQSQGWKTEMCFCSFAFLLSIISILLSCNALRKSFNLAMAMGRFYHTHLNLQLTWWQRSPLFEYWHFINIISDAVILPGTVINFALDLLYTCGMLYYVESVRILLGIGIVLQTAVILRYTGCFKQLYAALDIAFPQLINFLVCVGVLFLSFMLCGWMALEPFHYKFSTYGGSFYTLFSMLNGDDLWDTYTGMNSYDNNSVYVFSQVFFTIFLILFIYAILNLFLALIIKSYDESKSQDSQLKDEVRRFVFSGPLTPGGVALKDIIPNVAFYVDPEIIKQQIPPSQVKVSLDGNIHRHYY